MMLISIFCLILGITFLIWGSGAAGLTSRIDRGEAGHRKGPRQLPAAGLSNCWNGSAQPAYL